jgi:hypothetical protein
MAAAIIACTAFLKSLGLLMAVHSLNLVRAGTLVAPAAASDASSAFHLPPRIFVSLATWFEWHGGLFVVAPPPRQSSKVRRFNVIRRHGQQVVCPNSSVV